MRSSQTPAVIFTAASRGSSKAYPHPGIHQGAGRKAGPLLHSRPSRALRWTCTATSRKAGACDHPVNPLAPAALRAVTNKAALPGGATLPVLPAVRAQMGRAHPGRARRPATTARVVRYLACAGRTETAACAKIVPLLAVLAPTPARRAASVRKGDVAPMAPPVAAAMTVLAMLGRRAPVAVRRAAPPAVTLAPAHRAAKALKATAARPGPHARPAPGARLRVPTPMPARIAATADNDRCVVTVNNARCAAAASGGLRARIPTRAMREDWQTHTRQTASPTRAHQPARRRPAARKAPPTSVPHAPPVPARHAAKPKAIGPDQPQPARPTVPMRRRAPRQPAPRRDRRRQNLPAPSNRSVLPNCWPGPGSVPAAISNG